MIEPLLHPIAISDLRPTQMTVGIREVERKRKEWHDKGSKKDSKFLGQHMIPVVIGPKEHIYSIDHHHFARALHDEGVKDILTNMVADLKHLEMDAFWFVMNIRGWVFPYDAKGKRHDYSDIPKHVEDLKDDPFRSLAGELRENGGYAKETVPFSEFLWADFLRRRIRTKDVEKGFADALKEALALAKRKDADYLPGWCGPTKE
jgi:hypothetical protein